MINLKNTKRFDFNQVYFDGYLLSKKIGLTWTEAQLHTLFVLPSIAVTSQFRNKYFPASDLTKISDFHIAYICIKEFLPKSAAISCSIRSNLSISLSIWPLISTVLKFPEIISKLASQIGKAPQATETSVGDCDPRSKKSSKV